MKFAHIRQCNKYIDIRIIGDNYIIIGSNEWGQSGNICFIEFFLEGIHSIHSGAIAGLIINFLYCSIKKLNLEKMFQTIIFNIW